MGEENKPFYSIISIRHPRNLNPIRVKSLGSISRALVGRTACCVLVQATRNSTRSMYGAGTKG